MTRRIEYDDSGQMLDPHLHQEHRFVAGEDDEPEKADGREVMRDRTWVSFTGNVTDPDEYDWYGLDSDGEIRADTLRTRYIEMVNLLHNVYEDYDSDCGSCDTNHTGAQNFFENHGFSY